MQYGSIDEFDVGQILGRGGFGMVHRARHRSTGRDVALKIIDKQHMRGANMTGRVVNEVTLHSALRHPHVVELLGYFEDDHCVYLVMELCCRGDLYRYVRKKGRLHEDEAAALLVQVLSALAYLHRQHIVHRDLKLSNLLLTREHVVKLSDFGLAVRLQTPDEEHYTICGTPNYIAPEMATQGPHGLPADLWSVGCLFYTLVAGKAPFQGGETSETLERASKGQYCMPTGLSEQAVDFLQSVLQTDPDHRMSITSVLAHPFIRRHSACLPSPCSPPPLPATKRHDDASPFQAPSAPSCPLPPVLKQHPYSRPPSSSSATSCLGPCSPSTHSTATTSTAVQTMDTLEPVSAHTAHASGPTAPLPPPLRPASGKDMPPPSQACPQPLPPTVDTVSPPPAPTTVQPRSTGGGDGVSRPSPPSARKRRLPGPLPPTPQSQQAPPPPPSSAPLLTPLCTDGLPPRSFPLPRRSSLRLHPDGRLTLRLPSASLRITHHGLRVHVTPSSTQTLQDSPTTAAASGPTAHRGPVYTYSLMELPLCWRPAYTYAARLVDRIRSRVPKVTLFVLRRPQQDNPSVALPSTLLLEPSADTAGAPVAKCLLMSNGPLPDFLVRWVDGTCLSYQLSSGTLSLRMASPKAGDVEPSVLEWCLKGRSHGWSSVCGNSRANTYLRLAQQAMLRCLELEPTSATPSSTGPASHQMKASLGSASSSCVFYEYVDALEGGHYGALDHVYMPPPRPAVTLPAAAPQPRGQKATSATERIEDAKASLQGLDSPAGGTPEQGTEPSPSEPPVSAVAPQEQLETSTATPNPTPSPQPPASPPLVGAAATLPPVPTHAVEVEGVGRGWRDESTGQLVVLFQDGAVLRLSQDADTVTYCPSAQAEAEGSADLHTYPLPGMGAHTASRGKIPKPVRDRMRHLAAFIQKLHV